MGDDETLIASTLAMVVGATICPTNFPFVISPGKVLEEPPPEAGLLQYEAGGSKQHKSWTVLDAVVS